MGSGSEGKFGGSVGSGSGSRDSDSEKENWGESIIFMAVLMNI